VAAVRSAFALKIILLNLPKISKMPKAWVQHLNKEIRTTSYLLHPLLDESGLSSALNWYVQGLKERSGLDVALKIPEKFGRLPADMECAFSAPGRFQCGIGPAHPPRVSALQQAARLGPLFQSASPPLAAAIHRSSGCP
jgi:hypothetical protein